DLKVPSVGESITEVYIGRWQKQPGERVEQDEAVVELESEKATFDAPAPAAGVIDELLKQEGELAEVGEVIARIRTDEEGDGGRQSDSATKRATRGREQAAPERPPAGTTRDQPSSPDERPSRKAEPERKPAREQEGPREQARRAAEQRREEHGEPADFVPPGREEDVVPMSPIRRRIAGRLVQAQQQAALLTTFNEIDMSAVKMLRTRHQSAFQDKYGIKLGFMSFFVKAAIDALAAVPDVNAEIRGSDIVYRNYYDIGIAIGGGKGLVVPVLRSAERMSFAEIEQAIDDFAKRAQAGDLRPDELRGGTFTISNGGIYGSLLSTPIVNPPQSGVLGMHAIQDRPVVQGGQIVARPMMYVALTYDHRLIDGREAVTFLRRIKEVIEDPVRLLIEI
ncbi:MAG TPA: 2-oxoglutarate dehydrogenase complex dihydrolipoyllysine-residue succinyltransferase, partial [Planctomycetaceae bacterium]|nr:2-oxoglutarate dehydrogenase complex dihydrolipoyllysine-residue succinyltransferase [Planctomycetaceae bacterium]